MKMFEGVQCVDHKHRRNNEAKIPGVFLQPPNCSAAEVEVHVYNYMLINYLCKISKQPL